MGFSRQEHWRGLPFRSPGDLPDPGIEPRSPAVSVDALPSELPGEAHFGSVQMLITKLLLIQSFMFKIYENYEFTDKMINLSLSTRNLQKITRRHSLKKLPKTMIE